MEKTLSADERIRRAEEIYYRRKLQNYNRESATVNVGGNEKTSLRFFDKMLIQILVCVIIYTGFYFVKNADYIFSDDVVKKANEILEYDINVPNLYDKASNYIKAFIDNKQKEGAENTVNNETTENVLEENTVLQEVTKDEEEIKKEDETQEQDENLTQEQIDANEIISKYSFINPLPASVVTSEFGERQSTNPQVTPNHTGIDLRRL